MARERFVELKPQLQKVRVIDSNVLLALRREKEGRSEQGTLGKIVKVIRGKR